MNWMKNWTFRKAASGLTGLWAFLLLTAFPLYAPEQYSRMGIHKFEFFLGISAACLLPAAFFSMIGKPDGCLKRRKRIGMSVLDWAMLAYLAACLLSWAFAIDRQQGWTGISGWFMGLRTQIFFVLIYFLVSRGLCVGTFWKKALLAGHLLGAGTVFLLGVLHRFRIDPLDLYRGLDDSVQLLFLSTIGQASWYSGYVCLALVPGAVLFFAANKTGVRLVAGLFCALGFSTVVTQNSDSAFAAMGALFFVLFLLACESPGQMERFFETLLLMLGSFKLVGVLQQLFWQEAVQLGGLSEFFSQSTQTWAAFLAVCLAYMGFLLYRQKDPGREAFPHKKGMRTGACVLAGGAVLLYGTAVWLNTSGLSERLWGISSRNQYLLFDRFWGNSRGFTWKFTLEAFWDLPFWRKLTGVGPDCFAAWCYKDPQLGGQLDHFFGWNQTLTNAHNEFLNVLFCLGILGFLAFCAVFAAAFWRCFRAAAAGWIVPAAAAGVCVYAAHNFFCYQQICCAPFLFLLLGLAENAIRFRQEETHRKEGSDHTTF